MNLLTVKNFFDNEINQVRLTIFYISFLLGLSLFYYMSVINDKKTKILFKMICENYNPSRNIKTNKELKTQYLEKYISFINGNNQMLTNIFLKNLEFAVAEKIIKTSYFIGTTKNEYLKVLAKTELSKIYNLYLDIFDFYQVDLLIIIKSLQIRTMQNICHIHTDVYTITNVTNEFFSKSLGLNLESSDLEEIKNKSYKIYNTKYSYNLKSLKRLTNYILNSKNN